MHTQTCRLVMKYEPALWATALYSEDSEFYSLDLRACTVFFENLVLRLVFVMVLSAFLDSWSITMQCTSVVFLKMLVAALFVPLFFCKAR